MKEHDNENREGVAIIIVLGMMAIFMLAGVAFSISMRLERLGASNYRYGSQARHMLWSALANALKDIDESMDNPTNTIYYYPPWDVLVSDGALARVVPMSVLDYVPGALLTEVMSNQFNCGWHIVKADRLGESVVRGRFAYMVINLSGLLDANFVGGKSREHGGDPAEINIDWVPSIASKAGFLADRDDHVRYETLPELVYQNSGIDSNSWPEYLTVHSLAKVGEYLRESDMTLHDKYEIGADVAELENNTSLIRDITNGFDKCGIEKSQISFVYSNLLDYVDADCVPRDLGAAYTEKVPMFSEFQLTNRLTLVGGMAHFVPRVHVEFHYPFVEPSSNLFAYRIETIMSVTNPGGAGASITFTNSGDTTYDDYVDKEVYLLKKNVYFGNMDVPATNGQVLRMRCRVRGVVLDPYGNVVDAAPFPTNQFIEIANGNPWMNVTVPSAGAVVWISAGKECVDPRFNWDATSGNFWRQYPAGAHTLEKRNAATDKWYAQRVGCDEGAAMHVSDRGRLLAVGELGNLLRGQLTSDKWKTIRLYHRDADYKSNDVFNVFCLTNTYRHGLVNINTTHRDVLKAALLDIPIGFPNTPPGCTYAPTVMTAGQSDTLIDAIMNVTVSNDLSSVQQLARLDYINWTALYPGMSDQARESIYAYAVGLLTARQNMFLVLLKADSYTMMVGGKEGSLLASTMAMAIVSRDPYPMSDAAGTQPAVWSAVSPNPRVHPYLVRYFRILK